MKIVNRYFIHSLEPMFDNLLLKVKDNSGELFAVVVPFDYLNTEDNKHKPSIRVVNMSSWIRSKYVDVLEVPSDVFKFNVGNDLHIDEFTVHPQIIRWDDGLINGDNADRIYVESLSADDLNF